MKISTLSANIIPIIASAFNSSSSAAPASAGNVNKAVANLPQARTINSNWGLYDNNQLINADNTDTNYKAPTNFFFSFYRQS